MQSDAETNSKHESEQSINTGSGTHQTDMFDDTIPENSFHRRSVNESDNDENEREIAIQSPNQNIINFILFTKIYNLNMNVQY